MTTQIATPVTTQCPANSKSRRASLIGSFLIGAIILATSPTAHAAEPCLIQQFGEYFPTPAKGSVIKMEMRSFTDGQPSGRIVTAVKTTDVVKFKHNGVIFEVTEDTTTNHYFIGPQATSPYELKPTSGASGQALWNGDGRIHSLNWILELDPERGAKSRGLLHTSVPAPIDGLEFLKTIPGRANPVHARWIYRGLFTAPNGAEYKDCWVQEVNYKNHIETEYADVEVPYFSNYVYQRGFGLVYSSTRSTQPNSVNNQMTTIEQQAYRLGI